ncbi:HD-like signal output (HDOD) domain, no enzymatic activity [Mariprofundus ferrinatatus]|uniref:HD-like signal output (HDOD) domain, no enzymatic activity n=1 Tax=Mariprofundus ferrinatatus TaxID=1921087 RepID=A0A2K8L9K6_9PROT|nr:HDOD domain-containing protein [Mariprofundus ferrinatatus]ATX81624.1 HD-like signal output (HDOD) domain, no enzymatic activity [Mariprofundus ferrinatatus]
MTTNSSEDLKQRLTEMVDSMPAFPESVCRIIEITSDINCSPKELVKVVERDPVMTMKILKMVNSAFFALARNVSSVQHALVYLGLNTIKNLAVSIATIESLPRQSIPELKMSDFLVHSLATASVAQWLAKNQLNIRDASDHFVGGLLHDFGKAVFIQFEPATYGKLILEAKAMNLPLAQVEMEHLGVSSAEVGALLAEKWQLPEQLVNCIRTQLECNKESSDLVLTVAAANTVVKAMHLGDNGDPYIGGFSDVMSSRLGCNLEDVVAQMQGLPDEVNRLLSMVRG